MAWSRRGLILRLVIYIPLFVILGWRAYVRCNAASEAEAELAAGAESDDALQEELAKHRKMITLPDGTQQEIVELTPQEAEAILGHPLPRGQVEGEGTGANASPGTAAGAAQGAGTAAETEAMAAAGTAAEAGASTEAAAAGETEGGSQADADAAVQGEPR